MEHLCLARHSKLKGPYVPLFFNASFDLHYEDFTDYPLRNKWDKDHLLLRDGSSPTTDSVALLQTWLYFGLLRTVCGTRIDKSEFLRVRKNGDVVLTTKRLDRYIERWKKHEDSLRGPKYLASPEVQASREALSETSVSLQYLCQAIKERSSTVGEWESLQLVVLSIAILGSSLEGAIDHQAGWRRPHPGMTGQFPSAITSTNYGYYVTKRLPANDWGYHRWIETQLMEKGWCLSDIHRQSRIVGVTGLLFALSLPRKHKRAETHSNCTSKKCFANDIATDYKTRHVNEECNCGHLEALGVKEILESGKIPVVHFSDIGQNEIMAAAADPSMFYVAISHVWSDGLGNKNCNSLPLCQLRRIQSKVEEALEFEEKDLIKERPNRLKVALKRSLPKRKRPINSQAWFWMDTLCVPPLEEKYKTLAIQRMTETYVNAEHVLVFDHELQQTKVSRNDIEDLLMLISCSGWMRRVWTFQEGALAKSLIVCFRDELLSVQEEVYDTLHGWWESDYVASKVVFEATHFYDIFRNVREGYDAADRSILKSLIPSDESLGATSAEAFMASIYSFQGRTTTNSGDELICMGTLLNMGNRMMELHKTAETERTKKLLSFQKALPQALVFAEGPKLKDLGYRWAPSQLLDVVFRDTTDLSGEFHGEQGLDVVCAGLILHLNQPPASGTIIASRSATDLGTVLFAQKNTPCFYKLSYGQENHRPDKAVLEYIGHEEHNELGLIFPHTGFSFSSPAVLVSVHSKSIAMGSASLSTKRHVRYICSALLRNATNDEIARAVTNKVYVDLTAKEKSEIFEKGKISGGNGIVGGKLTGPKGRWNEDNSLWCVQ